MTARAIITGVGIVSAFGLGRELFAKALFEGDTAFSRRSFGDGEVLPTLPSLNVATVEDFSIGSFISRKGLRTLNRESRMLLAAAVMAARDADLDLDEIDPSRLGVVTATNYAGLDSYTTLVTDALRYGMDRINPAIGPQTGFNSPASQLSIVLGLEGPNLTLNTGIGAGVTSLAKAARLIEDQDLVLMAGGVDVFSYLLAYSLVSAAPSTGEYALPRPFDLERRGPAYGEGASVFIVESRPCARRRGAGIYGEISGLGTAYGAPSTIPQGASRAAAQCAINYALEDAEIEANEVDGVVSSAQGHPSLDAAEANILYDLFGPETPVYGVKGAIGECFGAGGAFQVAAALLSMEHRLIPLTPGFYTPDPALPPLNITRETTSFRPRNVLVSSMDAQHATAVILSSPSD